MSGPAAPAGQVPAGPWQTRRRRYLVIGGLIIAVAIGVVVALVVAFAPKGDPAVVAADEAADLPRGTSSAGLLAPLGEAPKVEEISTGLGEVLVVGERSVVAVHREGVVILDLDTGEERADIDELPQKCALDDGHLACVVGGMGSGREFVVFDENTGRELARASFPGRTPDTALLGEVVAVDGLVLVRTGAGRTGPITAFDATANIVWQGTGGEIYPEAGIVVAQETIDSEVVFLRASDGGEITRAREPVELTLSPYFWSFYRGGVAVLNEAANGTDFYALDGTRTASLPGWQAVDSPGAVPAVPMMTRIVVPGDMKTERALGAANPATGHLLWRTSERERAYANPVAHVGDSVVLRLSRPVGESGIYTADRYQLFDVFTGEERSVPFRTDVVGEMYLAGDAVVVVGELGGADRVVGISTATGELVWADGWAVTNIQRAGERLVGFDATRGIGVLVP